MVVPGLQPTTSVETVARLAAPGCFLFASEAVNEGHPDKIADQISDAIVDECISLDPDSKVACETITKTGMVMIIGEITTRAKVDYDTVIRNTVKHIGYDTPDKGLDYKTMEVVNKVNLKSPPSKMQDVYNDAVKSIDTMVASDQGLMFGYATNETPELMPLTHILATKLCMQLGKLRRDGSCSWIRPDGKAQVIVEYRKADDGSITPMRIHTVVISAQHSPDVRLDRIKGEIMEKVIWPVIPAHLLDGSTTFHINPSGRFVIGGPHGDAGLTGRQTVTDTFGGWGGHGNNSFSGKDPSNVERSASYLARWAAKSLVKAGFAARCLVQTTYAAGLSEPVSLLVNSYGSAKFGLSDEDLRSIVRRNFDFRPGIIMQDLKLRTMKFQQFATYGHFGREDVLPEWEKCKDLTDELAKVVT